MKAEKISPSTWIVEGDSGNDYVVFYNPRVRRFICTCPGYVYKLKTCKHISYILNIVAGGERSE